MSQVSIDLIMIIDNTALNRWKLHNQNGFILGYELPYEFIFFQVHSILTHFLLILDVNIEKYFGRDE